MKVLHVETGRHLYGGPQQVLWLIDGLKRHGIESVLVGSSGSAVAAVAQRRGIRTIAIRCGGDLDLLFCWRLYSLLKTEQPDLVHCHSRRGADWLGGRAARAAGIPALVSRRVDNREAAWRARLRYRPYQRIVAISDTIAGVLRDDGVESGRIETIRSAVDATVYAQPPDKQRFLQLFELQEGTRTLFCVGQLIPRKGHRFLLEALAKLQPRYPDIRLVLFGQGPTEAQLRLQVTQLGLDNVVHFAGFRDDLDSYLGCAQMLVHPALEEGLGVAALKAAAAGVAVVAFAAGGLREAVVHGETGLLVPPRDVDALASAIAELLDDPDRCRQFGENGKRRMHAEFTTDRMVEAHVQLYRTLIDD